MDKKPAFAAAMEGSCRTRQVDLFLIVSCNKGFYLTIQMSQAVKICMLAYGRGWGVGRDLGVGAGLAVELAVAVGVAVGVAVTVTAGVAVAVAVTLQLL